MTNPAHPLPGAPTAPPEVVIARLRSHARALFWPTLFLIGACGVTGYYSGSLAEPWQNVLLLVGAGLVVVLLWLLPLVAWLTRRYTVTSRRIIFVHGIFVHERQELLHSRGYDVTVRRNWLQSLFRSGTVRINSGLEHPLSLRDVPDADLVQQVLQDLMEQSQTVMAARRQEQSALGDEFGLRAGL
jgi:membrane protein YdbS with pleckstrin-like domain